MLVKHSLKNTQMKKILFSVVSLLIVFSACQTADNETNSNNNDNINSINITDGVPEFKFEETEKNFGELIQGEKASHIFEFTNVGNAPLVIDNIKTSCGCTVPEYTEKPIEPNEKGEIKITFNTAGKKGSQHKSITILSNTENFELVIKAKVVAQGE